MTSDDLERFAGLPRRALAGGRVVIEATTHRARRRGLARLDALPADQALLIGRCRSVHTLGMRFALDLIWIGPDGRAVRVDRAVPALRVRTCLRARAVIETGAGEADAFLAAGAAEPTADGPAPSRISGRSDRR